MHLAQFMDTATCAPALPSGASAYRVISGDMDAVPEAAMHWVLRSCLVGSGLYLAGARGWPLVKYSLSGAAAIEAFVVGWALWKSRSTP